VGWVWVGGGGGGGAGAGEATPSLSTFATLPGDGTSGSRPCSCAAINRCRPRPGAGTSRWRLGAHVPPAALPGPPAPLQETVVRRERVAVLTQGTLTDAEMLGGQPEAAYLMALAELAVPRECALEGGFTRGGRLGTCGLSHARLQADPSPLRCAALTTSRCPCHPHHAPTRTSRSCSRRRRRPAPQPS
jgi:hypothetical protein